jgi:hypothetical protein
MLVPISLFLLYLQIEKMLPIAKFVSTIDEPSKGSNVTIYLIESSLGSSSFLHGVYAGFYSLAYPITKGFSLRWF